MKPFDSIQLALFTRTRITQTAADLWQTTFGELPENFQKAAIGISNASGPKNGFNAVIQVAPNRVDVFMLPADSGPGSWVQIKEHQLALETAKSIAVAIGNIVEVVRPALIIQTSQETGGAAESVAHIKSQLPALPAHPDALDVFYQTTVPAPSSVDADMPLNRIVRWNTARKGFVAIDQSAGPTVANSVPVAINFVDISTSHNKDIPKASLPAYLDCLESEAIKILEGGFNAL